MPDLLPYKNKWLCSYETLKFDTADGDLGSDQYASHSDKGYYVRILPKSEGQFTWTDDISKIAGLEKVAVLKGQHCYYDEFRGADGKTVRVQSTGKKYWDTALIKDHAQPARTEMVSEIPVFPEDFEPPEEHHSIGFDAASNSGAKNYVSSYSWSHECTGDNRLLVVGVSIIDPDSDFTVTGITFNSDAMTEVRSDAKAKTLANYVRTALYYRIAPDTGDSYTVAVILNDTSTESVGGAVSYTGAEQANQPDAQNGGGGSGGTPSTTVTTNDDNSWVVAVAAMCLSETSGNTSRWSIFSYAYSGGADTGGPKTPAGDQVMSWSSTSFEWVISAASFSPATAGGDVSKSLSALFEVEANNVRKLTLPLSSLIEVEAAATLQIDLPKSISVLFEVEAEGTRKLLFPLNSLVEVEASLTRELSFPLSSTVEVEAETQRLLLFPLSSLIEAEAEATLHIALLKSISALLEVEAELVRKLAFPLSSLVEIEADLTLHIGLFKSISALIEIEANNVRKLTLPLSSLIEVEAAATLHIILEGAIWCKEGLREFVDAALKDAATPEILEIFLFSNDEVIDADTVNADLTEIVSNGGEKADLSKANWGAATDSDPVVSRYNGDTGMVWNITDVLTIYGWAIRGKTSLKIYRALNTGLNTVNDGNIITIQPLDLKLDIV